MGDQSKHVKQTKAPNRGAENVVTIIRFQQEQQQQLTASLRHLRDYTHKSYHFMRVRCTCT